MMFNSETLKRVWSVELEILSVFHEVCEKHGLMYSLAFGTLLGQVRHGGFIPWDDDIDLIMPRKDYDKLIGIWNMVAPPGYLLQNKDTDPDFTQNFSKIRKNHTAFLQKEEEKKVKYHKGIFIDIAPCDRVAPNSFMRTIQYFFCAVNLLYSREHTSGCSGLIGVVEKILLFCPTSTRNSIRHFSERVMKHWSQRTDLMLICPDTIQNCRRYLSPHLFDNCQLVSFEGKKFYAIDRPEDFLSVRYGDYIKLPPKEERVWKHHPVLIDFEHNYEELCAEQ